MTSTEILKGQFEKSWALKVAFLLVHEFTINAGENLVQNKQIEMDVDKCLLNISMQPKLLRTSIVTATINAANLIIDAVSAQLEKKSNESGN